MIATTLRHIARLLAFTVCSLLMVKAATAGEPSVATDTWSSAKLIAGSNAADAEMLRAGLEIKLAAGWITYWRYPGDSGVPPRLDFSGSDNVASVDVRWPAPERIVEGGDTIIGYTRDVILPLSVRPKEPGSPVTLRVKLDYAVCQKLCVPVGATLALPLNRAVSADDAVLGAAEARVPKTVPLGQSAPLAIKAVRKEGDGPATRVVVDVVAHSPVEVFAEGPSPDWALPVPQPIDGAAPGEQRFSFGLDGIPAGATIKGAVLTLTAVGDGRAIEAKAALD